MFKRLYGSFLTLLFLVSTSPIFAGTSGVTSNESDLTLFENIFTIFGAFGTGTVYLAYVIGSIFLLAGLVMLKQAYDRQGSVGTPITLIVVAALLLSFGAIIQEANTMVAGQNTDNLSTVKDQYDRNGE